MGSPSYNINRFIARESLSGFLPWINEIDPGIYYLKDGSLGFVLELSPLAVAGEETAKILEDMYNIEDFPEGTVIELFLYASPDISGVLHDWSNRRTRGGLFERLRLSRMRFYEDASRYGFFPDIDFRPRNFRLFLAVNAPSPRELSNPFKSLWLNATKESKKIKEISLEEIKKLREIVKGSLGISNIPCVPVGGQGLISLLNSIFNPTKSDYQLYDTNKPLRDQIIWNETSIRLENDRFYINDNPCRLFTVSSYPNQFHISQVGALIGDDFQMTKQIMTPFFVTLKVIKDDFEKAKKSLTLKGAIAQKQSLGIISSLFPKVAIKAEDYAYAMSAIEAKKIPAKAFYSIGLMARNDQELERSTQYLKGIYRLNGFTLQQEKEIQLPVFLCSLPLAYKAVLSGGTSNGAGRKFLSREYTALTNNFAHISPVEAEWKGSVTPTLLFFARKGQAMPIDLFDSKTGYNFMIIGETGGGKSFLANEIITSYLSQGAKIWVVEIGKSYERACKYFGGKTIVFNEDSTWNLNPFGMVTDLESEEFRLLTPILAKMAAPSRDLSDIERSLLEQAVLTSWQDKGNRAEVRDVIDALKLQNDPRSTDIASMLFPWSEGRFSGFLKGNDHLDLSGSFVFLDLEGLKDKREVLSVVLLLLLFRVRREVYFGNPDEKKIVMLDEAWDLLNDPMSSEFMEHGFRRFRKYGACIGMLVQGLNDVYDNPRGRVMVENSAFTFFLPQKAESIDLLRREAKLNVGEYEIAQIKSLTTIPRKFSEVYIRSNYGSGVGRLIVDPFSYMLYTTQPDERGMLDRLMDSGLSVEEAIEKCISE